MKWIKRIIIVVVILLVVVGVALTFYTGQIIESALPRVGSKALGVDVTLDSARVYPLRGKANLKGLMVGNPEGFKSDNAFRLGEVDVRLDLKSVLSDRIVIHRIYVDAPEITLEGSLRGRNNIKQLLEGLESGTTAEEPAVEEPRQEAEKPASKGKKIQINEFTLDNAKVRVSISELGGKGVTVPMPTIRLTDIGKDKGASPQEVAALLVAAISRHAMQAVGASSELLAQGLEKAGETVGKLGEGAGKLANEGLKQMAGDAEGTAGEVVDKSKEAAERAAKGVAESAEKLKDSLGGLFKKKE